jgi:hypothetical protein
MVIGMMRMRAVLLCVGLAVAAGCGNNPTSPGTGGLATSATQIYSGTIAPGDTPSQPFSLPAPQTLHVMLASLTNQSGFPTGTPVTLRLGVQATLLDPCSPLASVSTTAGLQAQINVTASAGVYCVALADTAGLAGPTNYSIRVLYGTFSDEPGSATLVYESLVVPGGSTSRNFGVRSSGRATLLIDAFAPASVSAIGVGIGIPRSDGTGCDLALATVATRGSQASQPVDPGRYCIKVFDPGTFTQTVTFSARIDHP